jgi:hypothetical protein
LRQQAAFGVAELSKQLTSALLLRPLESTLTLCYIFEGSSEIFRRSTLCINPRRTALEPNGRVAQLAEHSALNRQVVGSIPTASTIFRQCADR